MLIQEYFDQQSKTDFEVALKIISDWSRDNTNVGIDWRELHAASNIQSDAYRKAGGILASAKERVLNAKSTLERARAKAYLIALFKLQQGEKVKVPGMNAYFPKMSASAAKDVAGKLEDLDQDVISADTEYITAVRDLTDLEKQLDAVRELSQAGKSTAQRLMQEPS